MAIDPNEAVLKIPSSMSLEQAMEEVRNYLETRNSPGSAGAGYIGAQFSGSGIRHQQFSLQATYITRLSEIAAHLGEVEPNSKAGAPGVFLKKLVRKLIGFYSRPVHQFDRTVIEALQQVRHDMQGLQQQIADLHQKIGAGSAASRITETIETTPRS